MDGWLIQGKRNAATAAREEARAELDIHGVAIIATKGHRGVRERPEIGASLTRPRPCPPSPPRPRLRPRVYTYTLVPVCVHTCARVCSHLCSARVCSHLCTCVFVHTCAPPPVCVRTYTLVPVCVHTCAPPPCVFTFVHVCVHTCAPPV